MTTDAPVAHLRPPDAGGAYLEPLLGRRFTDEQLDVITAPLAGQLVVAGAGSGKTTVMAARVVHAIAWHGLPPASILGLTFTNKAAGELAARVRWALQQLRAGRVIDADPTLDDLPTVSTYHAFAAQLLADHALRIGREPQAVLLTEAGRWQLAGRVVREARGPFAHLTWTPAFVARYVLDLDAELAEHLVTVEEVRAVDARLISQIQALDDPVQSLVEVASAARTREQLLDLVEAYRVRKRRAEVVDFGDQVALAAEIARGCPEVGVLARAEHRLVLLDEYQDTGVAQRVLLCGLFGAGHAVTAVGDPCQSIYGWRGASVGNLLRFFEHFCPGQAGQPRQLSTNFRSGARLLAVANRISEPLRVARPAGRRPQVPVRPLRAAPGVPDGSKIRCALLPTAADEAEWVADCVAAAVRAGPTRPGEVAVLCRRRADFPRLLEALVSAGLPVEVVGLGGLLDVPEVADVVATLEVLVDPTANPALMRLLSGPRWAVGPRDLAALGRRARRLAGGRDAEGRRVPAEEDPTGEAALAQATAGVDPCDVISLSEALESPGAPSQYSAEAVGRFARLAAELGQLRRLLQQPAVEAVAEVVTAIGLDVELLAGPPGRAAAAAANLAAFLDHAANFAGIEGEADARGFLDWLVAAREAEDGLDVGGVSAADTVKLLTVHKAKGLEWEVVAVPGLVKGTFPSDRGRPVWISAARVLPYTLRGDAADLPADPAAWVSSEMKSFEAACKAENAEEERRLAYVAITRARRTLVVSGYQWSPTRTTICAPSVYLEEVREHLQMHGSDANEWPSDDAADPVRPAPAGGIDVAWPVTLDDAARDARQQAAGRVQAALDGAEICAGQVLDAGEAATVARWQLEADLLLEELVAERTAVRDVPVPRSLTTSQVVRMRADPAGLAGELARPMPRRPSPAARRGIRFHSWVEEMFDQRPLITADELPGADAAAPDDAELDALRAAFERSPYAGIRPHRVEAPFQLVAGGHLVRGRIDAVYRLDAGRWDVLDYKTGDQPRDPAAAALQLAVYRLAWADIAGVPLDDVDAGFLYVRTGEVIRPAALPDRAGLTALLDAAGAG